MKIDILTLFPEMFDGFKNESIIKRAIESKKVEINTCNFRDFAKNKRKLLSSAMKMRKRSPLLDCSVKIAMR